MTDLWATAVVPCLPSPGIDVAGRVADIFTSAPLPGSQVYLRGRQCGVLTDSLGHFRMDGVQAGDTLVVSLIGYSAHEMTIDGGEGVGRALRIPLISLPLSLEYDTL